MAGTGCRVGIVGAGLMGRWHADAVRRSGGRVVAIADPDEAAARRLAGRMRGAETFRDGEALLAGVPVDVLHVCSPLETHAPLASLALPRGLGVLVEKPLAPDLATTETLVQQAQDAGAGLAPVHQFPFQRGFRRARRELARVGSLRHLELSICSAGGIGRDPAGLQSLLAEVLPHPLSVTRAVLQAEVSAMDWQADSPRPGELRLHGRAGEVSVEVFLSLASRPTENLLRIRGDAGTWTVDFFHGHAWLAPGGVSRGRKILLPFEQALRSGGSAACNLAGRILRREPAYPGLRELVSAFHASVRGEAPPPIPPEEILDLARARDGILASISR